MNQIANTTAIPVSSQSMLQESALLSFSKATADSLRLQILRVLKNHSFGVMELCHVLDIRQSNMSHHLKMLTSAGLLETRREGNSIFYLRAFDATLPSLRTLQNAFFESLDDMPIDPEIDCKLEDIHQWRLEKSQQFFQENAHRFKQQQDLISPYQAYAAHATEIVRRHVSGKMELALEVGPGRGEFLAELAPLFDKVYALDSSASMLKLAQQFCVEQKLSNVEFMHGDTRHSWLRQLQVDFVVVNMVLHHHPDPAKMFFDLAKVTKPSSKLLITDLAKHSQQWAKDNCGDLWLGFSHEELGYWATQAGFELITEANVSQRNGFSVMIKLFKKIAS